MRCSVRIRRKRLGRVVWDLQPFDVVEKRPDPIRLCGFDRRPSRRRHQAGDREMPDARLTGGNGDTHSLSTSNTSNIDKVCVPVSYQLYS